MHESDAEIGTTNVYRDLGFDDADGMLVKAKIVTRIRATIHERGLTQEEAAALFGIPKPQLSRMLRGQFREVSESTLIDYLARLGGDTRRAYAVEELPEPIMLGILALAREAERDGANKDEHDNRDGG